MCAPRAPSWPPAGGVTPRTPIRRDCGRGRLARRRLDRRGRRLGAPEKKEEGAARWHGAARKTPPSADKPRWNQDDYHQAFAAKLKEQIAQGVAPWQKPWTPGESRLPKNIQTDKAYRGGNSVYLSVTQTAKGYSDHRWATYKQIKEMGGQVRKGGEGHPRALLQV